VDVLVPNEHEAALLTGEDDPHTSARALVDLGVTSVVVTLGGRGSLCVTGNEVIEVPAERVEAVDTTAAGDTFAGCLAVALAEGRDRRAAIRWATHAAALSVQKMGASTSMPTREEIDLEGA
ncbi:MAG TPA: PfkB family carbohydrate kinase, partial [Nocardioidaceae bacterium]|nr:PfkB family carbohydrate kinase [Nocardioidaceae bacterium]